MKLYANPLKIPRILKSLPGAAQSLPCWAAGWETTLARLYRQPTSHIFRPESLPDQRRLQNPELVLGSLQGLIMLDEIQQMPELFSTLRVLVDRPENQARRPMSLYYPGQRLAAVDPKRLPIAGWAGGIHRSKRF